MSFLSIAILAAFASAALCENATDAPKTPVYCYNVAYGDLEFKDNEAIACRHIQVTNLDVVCDTIMYHTSKQFDFSKHTAESELKKYSCEMPDNGSCLKAAVEIKKDNKAYSLVVHTCSGKKHTKDECTDLPAGDTYKGKVCQCLSKANSPACNGVSGMANSLLTTFFAGFAGLLVVHTVRKWDL